MKKVMKRDQLIKVLKVALISTAILLISEGIFDIPAVTDWFSGLITGSSGVVVWLIIWAIMFLQVTILNVPAYVILSACVSIGIETLSAVYFFVVLSAYMCGCLLAYWLGYKFGKKAVKWCAGSEEDYNKWSTFLNKKGKIWYLLTIIFPFFPDDILCIVAGAVKFNFGWYALFNFVGRGIGLITTLLFLKFVGKIGGDFPVMLIVWFVLLIAEFVVYLVLRSKQKKESLQTNSNSQTENLQLEADNHFIDTKDFDSQTENIKIDATKKENSKSTKDTTKQNATKNKNDTERKAKKIPKKCKSKKIARKQKEQK